MSQALIDFDISHEEFVKITNEKSRYEGIKENIKNVKSVNDVNVDENKNKVTNF